MLNRFFEDFPDHLKNQFYLLFIQLNRINSFCCQPHDQPLTLQNLKCFTDRDSGCSKYLSKLFLL